MYNLLTWKDDDAQQWNYTKKNMEVVESNVYNKLKYKINKSSSPWVTENMDQYRKFAYSPSKGPICFGILLMNLYFLIILDLEDPADQKSRKSPSARHHTTKDLAEHIGKPHHRDHNVYVKEIPKKASEAIDKYAIQDLRNLHDVLKVIENRAIVKGGEVVKNPVVDRVNERLSKSAQQDRQRGYYDQDGQYHDEQDADDQGNEYDQGQGQQNQEDSDEDVEVEKLDLKNVKSKLLETKVRKAKELDPVYEKDRLDRRYERIKVYTLLTLK